MTKTYRIVEQRGEGGKRAWVIEDETGGLVDNEFYRSRSEAERMVRQYEAEDRADDLA
jgi:hypothetical protein